MNLYIPDWFPKRLMDAIKSRNEEELRMNLTLLLRVLNPGNDEAVAYWLVDDFAVEWLDEGCSDLEWVVKCLQPFAPRTASGIATRLGLALVNYTKIGLSKAELKELRDRVVLESSLRQIA